MPDINEKLEISEKIRLSQYEQLVLIQKKLAQASKEIINQEKHIDELKKKSHELEKLYDTTNTQFQDCLDHLERSKAEENKVRNIVLTLRPSLENPKNYPLPELVSETLDGIKKIESDSLKKKSELEALLEEKYNELTVLTEKMVVAETKLSALQQGYAKLSLLNEEEVLKSKELYENVQRIDQINLSLSDKLIHSEYALNQAQSRLKEKTELNCSKDNELSILTRQLILLGDSNEKLKSETKMLRDDSIQLRRAKYHSDILAEQLEIFEKENGALKTNLRKLEKTSKNCFSELSIITQMLLDEQHWHTAALREKEKFEQSLKHEQKKSFETQTALNEKIISLKKQSEVENSALKDNIAELTTSLSNAKSGADAVRNQLEFERASIRELETKVKEIENSRAFYLKAKKAKEDFQNDINNLSMLVSSPKHSFLHPFKFTRRLKQLKYLTSIYPQISQLIDNNCFDDIWYTSRYVDIEAGRYNAVRHFIEFGWREERKPNKDFSFAKLKESSEKEALSLQMIIDNLN